MTFKKGTSGNPRGKRPGTRNRTTLAMEALLEGDAKAITRKAIQLAKAGDPTALRLCFDRLYPARRDRPIVFEAPELQSANDAAALSRAIVKAAAQGELTPIEAGELAKLVDTYTRAVTAVEHEQRIKALEEMKEERRG